MPRTVNSYYPHRSPPLYGGPLVCRAGRRSTISMEWNSYLTGILTTPIVAGLVAWLGKVWAGRILEKDRARYQTRMESLLSDLRTRNTKELFVHQVQFQKEFEVYKYLWKAALELARAGSQLRTLQSGAQLTPDEIRQSVVDSYRRLRDTVFDNRPFYAPDIYDTAKAMLNGLGEVVSSRQRLDHLEQGNMSETQIDRACELAEQTEQKIDEINTLLDRLCTLIRCHVWNTMASGWDRPSEHVNESSPYQKDLLQ